MYTTIKNIPKPACPVERSLEVIGGKWKMIIIAHLFSGTKRFNELRRLMPNISQRMLTRQLRELETHEILERKIYPEIPPKVEYSLTQLGKSLRPVLEVLYNWGSDYDVAIKNLRGI